jgi:hypothetical protein
MRFSFLSALGVAVVSTTGDDKINVARADFLEPNAQAN